MIHLRHSSFSKPFFHFSYVTSSSFNEQSSFSNLSVTSRTSQLILEPFRRFTYVTAHSPTLPLFHLRHSSFSNPSFASPTSQALHLILLGRRPCFVCVCVCVQLILQPFRHFTYGTTLSATLPSLYLRHSLFLNPSVASPTSQPILQSFSRFTYVTTHSPTLPLLHLCHNSFYNPSVASSSLQTLHLRHLASRPCSAG